MQRLADRAQRLRELLDRMMARDIARLEMHLGDAPIVPGDEAIEDFGEKAALLEAEPPHDAEIDGDEAAVAVDEEIALVHVGVEEAVAHGVAQEGLQHAMAQRRHVVPLARDAGHVGQRNAVDPLQSQHLAGSAVPVDQRRMKIRVFGDIVAKLRSRRRLQTEIGFELDGARQRVDDLDQPQAPPLRRNALDEARNDVHVGKIARELPLDAGAQHLDCDAPLPLGRGDMSQMHLGDRRSGHRLAEGDEQLFDRPAERPLDDGDGRSAPERRHAVLQSGERVGDLAADDVRPRRQKLPELHVRGADLREGGRQRLGAALARVFAADEFGEAQRQHGGRRRQIGIKPRKRAFARQNIAGARQPIEMSDAEDHGRVRVLGTKAPLRPLRRGTD